MTDFEYIRRTYGVSAKRGGWLWFEGRKARIIWAAEARLVVRFEDTGKKGYLHPLWHVAYTEGGEYESA